jgi:hypothetical protein
VTKDEEVCMISKFTNNGSDSSDDDNRDGRVAGVKPHHDAQCRRNFKSSLKTQQREMPTEKDTQRKTQNRQK